MTEETIKAAWDVVFAVAGNETASCLLCGLLNEHKEKCLAGRALEALERENV